LTFCARNQKQKIRIRDKYLKIMALIIQSISSDLKIIRRRINIFLIKIEKRPIIL
jgi:hypothetical protein